jgi:hypothetical protein
MERTFVYSALMTSRIQEFLHGELVAKRIEDEILKNPEAGDIVQGTGGLRKLRVADEARNKGKRGGLRVFYFDLADAARTHLIYLLRKGEAENISPSEKTVLKDIVTRIKREVR